MSIRYRQYGDAQLSVLKLRMYWTTLSRAEIARLIGMRPDCFNRILSGKRPLTIEVLGKLCTVLGTTQPQIHREALRLCQ